MTGGTAVVLGPVGANFAAGMTFVYDPEESFPGPVDPETVLWQRIVTPYWEEVPKALIAGHARETQSRFAAKLIAEGGGIAALPAGRAEGDASRFPEPLFLSKPRAQAGND